MNAVTILKEQHRCIERELQALEDSEDRKTRQRRLTTFLRTFAEHLDLEERVFYPAVEDGGYAAVSDAQHEHTVLRRRLAELGSLAAGDAAFACKLAAVKELTAYHFHEEEAYLFPRARKLLGAEALEELGLDLLAEKDGLLVLADVSS